MWPKNQLEIYLSFEIQFDFTWPASRDGGEPTDTPVVLESLRLLAASSSNFVHSFSGHSHLPSRGQAILLPVPWPPGNEAWASSLVFFPKHSNKYFLDGIGFTESLVDPRELGSISKMKAALRILSVLAN